MPKISIVISVYNVENYLSECLDSVINQTMRDIQIIIVNDGSTDNSQDIIDEYVTKDDRIKVVIQNNAGPSAARNIALPLITGEYTLFIDSDDYLALDLCKKTYEAALKNNAQAVIFQIERLNGTTQQRSPYYTSKKLNPGVLTSEKDRLTTLHAIQAWHKIIRTDLIMENHLRFPHRLLFEDNPFWVETLYHTHTVVVLSDVLYIHRIQPNSIMSTSALTKRRLDFLKITDCLMHFSQHHSLSFNFKKAVYRRIAELWFLLLKKTSFRLHLTVFKQIKKRLLIFPGEFLECLPPKHKTLFRKTLTHSALRAYLSYRKDFN